jgi:hypothetical protein
MKQIHRNIIKNLPDGQLLAATIERAKQYGEVWYYAPDGQMAFNDKGRKGYEHIPAIGITANGEWIQAS